MFNQMPQNRFPLLYILMPGLMLLILAGCSSTSQASTAASLITPVNVQLSWTHTIEFSGFYMAEEKGYYPAENLAVNLIPQNFDSPLDPIEQVVTGKAHFGVAGAGAILLARAEGKPVVAIAAIYQRNPLILISLAERDITRPEDLVGKTIMVNQKSAERVILPALLASQQGLDLQQVKIVQRTDFTSAPLINGEVDAIDAFINNEPVQLEQQGYKVNMIIPSNYGLDMYANVIFTTEEMIGQNPALVEHFVRATMRGIQSAVEDPQGAATLATARNKKLNFESELESMYRSLPLFIPSGSRPGLMKSEIWAGAHKLLLEQGVLKEPVEVEQVYTLTFLDKIYSQ